MIKKPREELTKPIAGQYAVYVDVIKFIVPYSRHSALSLTEIINNHEFKKQVEKQHPSLFDTSLNNIKRNKKSKKNPQEEKILNEKHTHLNIAWNTHELATFKAGIRRLLEKLVKTNYHMLIEIPYTDRYSGKRYYWKSLQAKEESIGTEIDTEQQQEAKITIYKFIDSYLSDFLPPEMLQVMQEDIENAAITNDNFSKWSGKLRFLPPNLEVSDKHSQTPEYIEKWQLVFSALRDDKVIKASYVSLHQESIPENLTLSPQRIEYHDQNVILLAYIHERQTYKSFHLYRLNHLSLDTFTSFHKINWDEYYTKFNLELRVAGWVAQSLLRSNFGINLRRSDVGTSEDSGRVVTLRGEVSLPMHFNKGSPDTFDCINYLSRYGDAINIIKPACLREEMTRRVNNMYELYATGDHRRHAKILVKSAHEQTENTNIINKLDKRY